MKTKFLACEQSEVAAVRAACSQKDLNEWFESSEVKARFKKAAMRDQGLRCCYCQKYPDTDNSNYWDLEHILCEDRHPQFFAVDDNLAVACKCCNIAKGNDEVLVDSMQSAVPLAELPISSENYRIAHPRLDEWDECLYHVNYQIYIGKNDKGEELRRICKLNEPAVKLAGLDYASVVAAAREDLFASMGSDLPVALTDEQVIEKIRALATGQENRRRDVLFKKLDGTLATLAKKALARKPADAIIKARALAARKKQDEALKAVQADLAKVLTKEIATEVLQLDAPDELDQGGIDIPFVKTLQLTHDPAVDDPAA
ncbi:hypothetical protein [Stenotrophomonas sp. B2]|uniref:HNH endonuclease n=1 Tax=Stenotrophomonas sp. B2 TaxID=1537778 RepID=UPI001874B1A9|nr:hypothetical protein [Stenotrophomonas sp. B2]MBE5271612.1 hypothetical protein [Stenotrophomonas sp. B2]